MAEGNYLIVNKTLIEIAALIVVYLFPTSQMIGLDRLIYGHKEEGYDGSN
jgi:thiosulfate dehydrogenase [quinone] large subunit